MRELPESRAEPARQLPDGLPEPPPIPAGLRLSRLALRAWPFGVWCAALVAAVWLYLNGAGGRRATVAMEEVEELKVCQTTAGRPATIRVAVGQHVRPGELLAMLDATDVERRLKAAREELERSRVRFAGWQKEIAGQAGTLDPRLVPFEQDLRTQEARVADLEAEGRKLEVLSPIAGTVSRVSGHPGEWKAAGGELLVLLASHPERPCGFIPERLVSLVGVGTPVTLRPRDPAGPPLVGRVIELGAQIEPVPARLRSVPGAPEWGQRVVFEVNPAAGTSLPGRLYDVRFH